VLELGRRGEWRLQCQYNYAMMLRAKGDPYSRLRAIYWMRKAAAQREELAVEALRMWASDNSH